jgi:uncharacterized protein YbjT (DUF2867 family)
MVATRTYAVTAAAGHVGGYAARDLLHAGHKVRAMGRDRSRLKDLEALGADLYVGDLLDQDFLESAFRSLDGALLICPSNSTASDFRAFQNQVGESYGGAARAAGLSHAVFVSCFGAEDDRVGGLIAGHADIEGHLNKVPGLNLVHIHAPSFWRDLRYREHLRRNRHRRVDGGWTIAKLRQPVKRNVGHCKRFRQDTARTGENVSARHSRRVHSR